MIRPRPGRGTTVRVVIPLDARGNLGLLESLRNGSQPDRSSRRARSSAPVRKR
jgi:hypothetical protein